MRALSLLISGEKTMEEKKYWLTLEELNQDPEYLEKQRKEFPTDPFETAMTEGFSANRRDFLKIFGFGVGTAAVVSACQHTPVRYALPYIDKPVETLPTVANWYASTYFDGLEYSAVLIKTREGRPIKVEGNKLSDVTSGGVSARGHAHVLNLYDEYRLRGPVAKGGKALSWEEADKEIMAKLQSINANKGGIRIVTGTIIGPSTRAAIERFVEEYPSAKHVTIDAISASGILEANEKTFGKRALPSYRFENADIIVGINADFLGTWLSPVEYTNQYTMRRRAATAEGLKSISRHIQFETNLTLTGSNADLRVPIKPSQEGAIVLKLYNELASALGGESAGADGMEAPGNSVAMAARELAAHKGRALVVSGSNDVNVQLLVNAINRLLGAYGSTIDSANYSNLRQGIDSEAEELIKEMQGGQVAAVFIVDTNPVYAFPKAKEFEAAFKSVGLKVSFAETEDETAALCDYILPTHNALEAWGDAQPYRYHYSVQQPTINPLFKTRQFQTSLLKYAGDNRDFYTFIKEYWHENIFKGGKEGNFEDFWKKTLHDGVYQPERGEAGEGKATEMDVRGAAQAVAAAYGAKQGKIDVMLYQKIGIGCGTMAGNPWLQEFPDPISKVVWDNYVTVPIKMAQEKKLKDGDMVKVEGAGGLSLLLPVVIQPGQQSESVGIALGYGRTKVGEAGKTGINAYPAAGLAGGNYRYYAEDVKITPTGESYDIARTQTQGTSMNRPVVKETTITQYDKYIKHHNEERAVVKHHLLDLYPMRGSTGHKWAMAIDLNLCTGCGACVISCQAENNIPVVGKLEVKRGRELHWMRIDRYYSSASAGSLDELEQPAENPQVIFQPMLCQHCNHAPCENVCPVLATVHSNEGLNQQAYNRCFGTRYCANNCPFKVRRFNWLDYANQDTEILGVVDSETKFKYNPANHLGKMVLNPDVTVRARGVMEKCSFCVQRLQEGKLSAKRDGRKLRDEEVQTACSQSCPAGAIVFGDINDPDSAVAKIFHAERSYQVLEEVKVYPSISYMVKVRNKPDSEVNNSTKKA